MALAVSPRRTRAASIIETRRARLTRRSIFFRALDLLGCTTVVRRFDDLDSFLNLRWALVTVILMASMRSSVFGRN